VFLIDVNVVLALHRGDHPQHATAHSWCTALFAGHRSFTIPPTVWASFLRITTNRRVFPVPSSWDEAFEFVESFRAHPRFVDLGPGARHVALLRRICVDTDARADLVPDAVLAAIALEHDCEIVTMDRDFARFGMVRHILLTD
jgi:toxin-antitoxin system PIN domain toxin